MAWLQLPEVSMTSMQYKTRKDEHMLLLMSRAWLPPLLNLLKTLALFRLSQILHQEKLIYLGKYSPAKSELPRDVKANASL